MNLAQLVGVFGQVRTLPLQTDGMMSMLLPPWKNNDVAKIRPRSMSVGVDVVIHDASTKTCIQQDHLRNLASLGPVPPSKCLATS